MPDESWEGGSFSGGKNHLSYVHVACMLQALRDIERLTTECQLLLVELVVMVGQVHY